MGYNSANDGCLFLFAIPFIVAWYAIKFVIAIAACCLVIPVRFIWLFLTIPAKIFTGEDHTADWDDVDFMIAMWNVFFPSK